MEYKTSSPNFLKYGTSIRNEQLFKDFEKKIINVDKSSFNFVYYNRDFDAYIDKINGITFIEISDDNVNFESFVINGVTKINKNQYFNFVTLTDEGGVYVFDVDFKKPDIIKLPKTYYHKKSLPTFDVSQIYYFSYSFKSAGYSYREHKHPIYELTYVDSGKLRSVVDGVEYDINKHEYMIYAPGQLHAQSVKEGNCSYLTLTFMLNLKQEYNFKNHIYNADEYLVNLFRTIIELDKDDVLFADYSLLKLKEILVISLLKRNNILVKSSHESYNSAVLMSIIDYAEENLHNPITIEDICYKFGISRTFVQRLFKSELNTTPKNYLLRKKLEFSKVILKEGSKSISEVAYTLGFTPNYFTRAFKREFGITPRECAGAIYDIREK